MAVPKLRFKKFKNDYTKYLIGDTLKVKSGRDQKLVECINGKYPILGTGGKIGSTNNFLCNKPSVLIGRKGTIDKPQYMDTPFWTVDTLFYTDINDNFNEKYIFYAFQNINWKKYDESTGVPSLSCKTIENITYYIPNKNEQEKIANFLSLLDKKIELQKQKIEAFKIYKMGLSKKLFDKNTNTNFKNCFSHFGGTSLEEYVTENATYNFISIGNYSPEGTYIDNGQRINNIEKAKDKILNKNDLVMVLNDKTSQGNIIGSTILIDEDNKYIYNQRSEKIKCNSNIIPMYAWCILNSTNIRNTIFKKSQGGTQIYINFHEIENLKLYVPSIEEQIKLSKVYYSIISKLNIENQKLNYLNAMKKSLLQQMFI